VSCTIDETRKLVDQEHERRPFDTRTLADELRLAHPRGLDERAPWEVGGLCRLDHQAHHTTVE
jgi:hypothetical protein